MSRNAEDDALINAYEERKSIIDSALTASITADCKTKAWAEITGIVNGLGHSNRLSGIR